MRTAFSTRSRDGLTPLTAFDYLYRDAGNFKARGTILLRGIMSSDDQKRLVDSLEAEEFFIAEQVAIPCLYDKLFELSDGPTPSDHAWHSFVDCRQVDPSETENRQLWGDTDDLLTAFESVSEWNVLLSPNAFGRT